MRSVSIIPRLFRPRLCRRDAATQVARIKSPKGIWTVLIDLPHARRLALAVVLAQLAVGLGAAGCAALLGGGRAGLSALLGAAIGAAGSLAMVALAFGAGAGGNAGRVLGAFYVGEAVKLVTVGVLFVLVLKTMSVEPIAMFTAFAATFLVYWIALLRVRPGMGTTAAPGRNG